jgi:hypothetical protein
MELEAGSKTICKAAVSRVKPRAATESPFDAGSSGPKRACESLSG